MSTQPIRLLEMNSSTPSAAATMSDEKYYSSSHVRVCTGDVLPLLADAVLANRAWVEDFADDTMEIPQDLYEVLLAYRRFRQSAA